MEDMLRCECCSCGVCVKGLCWGGASTVLLEFCDRVLMDSFHAVALPVPSFCAMRVSQAEGPVILVFAGHRRVRERGGCVMQLAPHGHMD